MVAFGPMNGIQGIVLDMDGTLVHSPLNFDLIRAELGLPKGEGILEAIDKLQREEHRRAAHQKLSEFEWDAARASLRIEGVGEFFSSARERGLRLGVFTRNSRPIAEFILKKSNLEVDILVAREDAPPKPDPSGLLKICEHWNLNTHQVIYIGDYLYDLQAGERANIKTWLYSPAEKPSYHHRADRVFGSYQELLQTDW